MKWILPGMFVLLSGFSFAQSGDYKVAYDCRNDEGAHLQVLRATDPSAKRQVYVHNKNKYTANPLGVWCSGRVRESTKKLTVKDSAPYIEEGGIL